MQTKIINLWTKVRSSLWFIPTMMTGSVIGMVFLTLFLDQYSDIGLFFQEQRFFAIGPQGARMLLATIAGSVIGIAGVSFSITIVALTLASSQFGPRLLNNFMKDIANQIVLGTFIATFIYCLLILSAIQDHEAHVFVPQLSIKVGLALTLISLGVFIFFIHHISVSIHAENVIAGVSNELEKAINYLVPPKIEQGKVVMEPSAEPQLPPNFKQEAEAFFSPTSGYLQAIDQQGIMNLAIDYDLLIHLHHRPGEFIANGEILATVWPPHHIEDNLHEKISRTFLIGNRRTEEQDVEFAIHQLVEIALRALSPGIHDPFTAIGCIDRLGGCLGLLADRTLPSAFHFDEKQTLRVVARPLTMDGIFNAAFNQIRQEGASNVAVGLRLLETFGVLASQTDHSIMQEPIRLHAKMVKDEMLGHIKADSDQKEVEKRYREVQNLLPPQS